MSAATSHTGKSDAIMGWGAGLSDNFFGQIVAVLVLPGLCGLFLTVACSILLLSRGAGWKMLNWGLVITIGMYPGFIPYVLMVEYLEGIGLLPSKFVGSSAVFLPYFIFAECCIIGVAAFFWMRRSPIP